MNQRGLTICLISEEFPPETGWGGIGTYAHNVARGLAELGHRVHVIARCWGERRCEQPSEGIVLHRVPLPAPLWRRGTWFINIRFPKCRHVALWSLHVSRVIDEIRRTERVDVIESPEYHAQGLVASLKNHVPMVVRLHTPTFLCRQTNGVSFGGSRWDTALSENAERWATKRAKLVTSPSRALAEDVSRHWSLSPRAAVRVIPNPIDEEMFRPVQTAPRDAHVLFVGRLERRKGVQTLIDAWPAVRAASSDARLTLVGGDHESGPGGTSMKAHLKKRLAAAQLPEDAVTFAGSVDRTALPQLYAGAKVCVVPSLYENFPYTCLEAMSCGCAVVATRTGGIPEIVTDGSDGLLVPPDDPAALASAIVRVLRCEELRDSLGRRARESIERRFSRAAVCAQTAELYAELSR